ncbi:MAG: hypothetical protein ACP5N7_01330 [Candidatus Pacearchaeota archaeon]
MIQDIQVERYIANAIKPLQKQINKLKRELNELKKSNAKDKRKTKG